MLLKLNHFKFLQFRNANPYMLSIWFDTNFKIFREMKLVLFISFIIYGF